MNNLTESEKLSKAINLLLFVLDELEDEDSNIGLSYRMEVVLDRLQKWSEEER
mgnify:CR=1 FL=1